MLVNIRRTLLVMVLMSCSTVCAAGGKQTQVKVLRPMSKNTRVAVSSSSHAACHYYLVALGKSNLQSCPGDIKTDVKNQPVLSRFAKKCSEREKLICDGRFECVMVRPFRGCEASFWQPGLAGIKEFFCQPQTLPDLINPHDAPKSFIQCATEDSLINAGKLPPKKTETNGSTSQTPAEQAEKKAKLARDKHVENLIANMFNEGLSLGSKITCEDVAWAGGSSS